MNDRLVTVEEVAEILGVSKSTAWRRVRTGAIKSVREGSALRRVRRSDLDNYIKSLPEVPAEVPA